MLQVHQKKKFSVIVTTFFLVIFFNNCKQDGGLTVKSQPSTSGSATLPSQNPPPSPPQPPMSPPTTPSEKVQVLVASGYLGRTMISCDDGITWIKNRSDNATGMCGLPNTDPNYISCDHDASAPTGMTYSDGVFFRSAGWGKPGTILKSTDGYNWNVVYTSAGITVGGIASSNGRLVSQAGVYSIDQGTTWKNPGIKSPIPNDYYFIRSAGNLFALFGRSAGMAISFDQGVTWSNPPTYNPDWAISGDDRSGGFVEANGILLTTGLKTATAPSPNIGYAARSVDGGLTWSAVEMFSATYARLGRIFYDGQYFVTWYSVSGQIKRLTSLDGINWNSVQVSGAMMSTTNLARSLSGTYITIYNQYASQEIYRSKDGLTWSKVPTTNFIKSHEIRNIVPGYLPASSCQ